jgi:hypothetical protein
MVGKSFGGMSITLEYTDVDDGTAADNQSWTMLYAIGF